jgi:hypothetical protein
MKRFPLPRTFGHKGPIFGHKGPIFGHKDPIFGHKGPIFGHKGGPRSKATQQTDADG